MDVHEAIMSGRSIRRFLPTPVPMDSLRRIIEGAGIRVAIATGDPRDYAPKLVRARCRVARPRHLYGL